MIQHSFAVGNAYTVLEKSLKRNSVQNAGILMGDVGKEIWIGSGNWMSRIMVQIHTFI